MSSTLALALALLSWPAMAEEQPKMQDMTISSDVLVRIPRTKEMARIDANGKVTIFWDEIEAEATDTRNPNYGWAKLLLYMRDHTDWK